MNDPNDHFNLLHIHMGDVCNPLFETTQLVNPVN